MNSRRMIHKKQNRIESYIEIKVDTGARQYFSDTLKKVLQGGH